MKPKEQLEQFDTTEGEDVYTMAEYNPEFSKRVRQIIDNWGTNEPRAPEDGEIWGSVTILPHEE